MALAVVNYHLTHAQLINEMGKLLTATPDYIPHEFESAYEDFRSASLDYDLKVLEPAKSLAAASKPEFDLNDLPF